LIFFLITPFFFSPLLFSGHADVTWPA